MQEILSLFYEILKYAFIGGVLLLFAHWLFSPLIISSNSAKNHLSSRVNDRSVLRLQAYERLVLLIERIRPSALLVRVQQPAASAKVLQELLLHEIRNEFEHNISQQLYVSDQSWNILKQLREDTITLIYGAFKQLPDDATSLAYSKEILSYLSGLEIDPYDAALALLKSESKKESE